MVLSPILLNSGKLLLALPQTTNQVHPIKEKESHIGGWYLSSCSHKKSLSRDAPEILLASWRVGKRKKCNTHIERFVKFYRERYTDPIQINTDMEIEILNEYLKTRVGYSSAISTRSALSSIIKPVCDVLFGKSPLVYRLLKGVLMLVQPS